MLIDIKRLYPCYILKSTIPVIHTVVCYPHVIGNFSSMNIKLQWIMCLFVKILFDIRYTTYFL